MCSGVVSFVRGLGSTAFVGFELILLHLDGCRRIPGRVRQCLPEQIVSELGHRLATALAFLVEGADDIVGQPGAIQGAWHGSIACGFRISVAEQASPGW
jgi:hypothetical protein